MENLKYRVRRMVALCASTCWTPVLFAAGKGWFPKLPTGDDPTTGNTSLMDILAKYASKGMAVLLFIVCTVTFIKFINTVSHGIEEAKKSEGGSMATFGTYSVMSIVYLSLSITSGYIGYTVITSFTL